MQTVAANFILNLKLKPRIGDRTPAGNKPQSKEATTSTKDASTLQAALTTTLVSGIEKFGEYAKTAQNFVMGITKEFESLNSGLNISTQQAAKLLNKFDDMAFANKDLNISQQQFQKTIIDLNKTIPGMGQKLANAYATQSIKELIDFQSIITTNLGMQAGDAGVLSQAFIASGQSVEDVSNKLSNVAGVIELATGETGVLQDMLSGIAQTSAATRMAFKGSTTELGLAALAANRMGTTLESIQKQAESTLDIESNIQAQLELQQLTGGKINAGVYAERMQRAALTGNVTESQKAQEDFLREYGDQLTSPFVQAAAAKIFGTDKTSLMNMNEQLKARDKLNGLIVKASDTAKGEIDKYLETISEGSETKITSVTELDPSQMDGLIAVLQASKDISAENKALVSGLSKYAKSNDTRTETTKLATTIDQLRYAIIAANAEAFADKNGILADAETFRLKAVGYVDSARAIGEADPTEKTTLTNNLSDTIAADVAAGLTAAVSEASTALQTFAKLFKETVTTLAVTK